MNFTCNSTAKLDEILASWAINRYQHENTRVPCSAIHTSFSLNDKRFEEFGEGDRPVADTELLVLLVGCLGILLLYCIACLYAFCHGKKGKLETEIPAINVLTSATCCKPIMSFYFCKYYQCSAEFFLSIQSITMLDLRVRPTSTSAQKKKKIEPCNL